MPKPQRDSPTPSDPHSVNRANPYIAPRALEYEIPPTDGFPRWGWRLIWGLVVVNGLLMLTVTRPWPVPELITTAAMFWVIFGVPISTGAACTWLALWKRYTPGDLAHRRTVLPLLVSIITVWGLMALGFALGAIAQ